MTAPPTSPVAPTAVTVEQCIAYFLGLVGDGYLGGEPVIDAILAHLRRARQCETTCATCGGLGATGPTEYYNGKLVGRDMCEACHGTGRAAQPSAILCGICDAVLSSSETCCPNGHARTCLAPPQPLAALALPIVGVLEAIWNEAWLLDSSSADVLEHYRMSRSRFNYAAEQIINALSAQPAAGGVVAEWVPWKAGDALPPGGMYWVTKKDRQIVEGQQRGVVADMIWSHALWDKMGVTAYWPIALPPPYSALRSAGDGKEG